MKSIEPPIIVNHNYDKHMAEVWHAITQWDEMRQWYFENLPAFEPQVGFETSFLVKGPNRDFLHQWKVTEVIHGKKIVYEWTFEGITGRSASIFELMPFGDGTLLRLTCPVYEAFPDDIPEFHRKSGIQGWNYFLGERLKNYLEGN